MCECSHKMNIINPYPVIMNDRKVLETKNSVAKMCGNPVVFQHFVVPTHYMWKDISRKTVL